MNPVQPLRKIAGAVDGWQRRNRWAGVPYGVARKFSDDNANLLVVSLAGTDSRQSSRSCLWS